MKKKVTNENVAEVIGKIADKIRSDMDYDYRVARSQMYVAENDLVNSLDKNQLELYNDFKKKREEFYQIASEIYTREF